MRKTTGTAVVIALLFGLGGASAKTPDGKTPAVETVCDNEKGAAFGLCNAYCEALDCSDPKQRASNEACTVLKRKFEAMTGRQMPCEVTCPCGAQLPLFNDLDKATVQVQDCIAYPTLLYVATSAGDYAFVDDGTQPSCSVNGQQPIVPLTPAEGLACRVALRRAVESHGVTCRSPE